MKMKLTFLRKEIVVVGSLAFLNLRTFFTEIRRTYTFNLNSHIYIRTYINLKYYSCSLTILYVKQRTLRVIRFCLAVVKQWILIGCL